MVAIIDEAKNRQVIAFGSAAGEHDFSGPASHQRSHRFPRMLHRRPRLLPVMMDGRRIAEALGKVRSHSLQDLREHRGSSVIVEINPPHTYILRCIAWS